MSVTERGPGGDGRAGSAPLQVRDVASAVPSPREPGGAVSLTATVLGELRAELARAGDAGARCRVHELIAGCLAARGEWAEAYHELRTSVDIGRGLETGREPHLVAEVARLRRETEEARNISMRDGLTESFNRRFLDQELGVLGRSSPTTLALVDLDLFKLVNDQHGHHLGDRVLQQVVELLQVDLPDRGFCARYGGEEFVLALPGTGQDEAVALCEAARARVEGHDWSRLAAGLKVTVSAGVAGPWCHDPELDPPGPDEPAAILRRADALLYAAKHSGRNAVAFRPAPADPMRLAGPASGRRLQVDAAPVRPAP